LCLSSTGKTPKHPQHISAIDFSKLPFCPLPTYMDTPSPHIGLLADARWDEHAFEGGVNVRFIPCNVISPNKVISSQTQGHIFQTKGHIFQTKVISSQPRSYASTQGHIFQTRRSYLPNEGHIFQTKVISSKPRSIFQTKVILPNQVYLPNQGLPSKPRSYLPNQVISSNQGHISADLYHIWPILRLDPCPLYSYYQNLLGMVF